MIDVNTVKEMIATYVKHGWILRRFLLNSTLKNELGVSFLNFSSEVKIVDSAFNAAWFSRPPKDGGVAWEIRYLGEISFALLENIDEEDAEFENQLRNVEKRLSDSIAEKRSA